MMSLEEAIEHAEKAANDYEGMIDDYALDSEKLAKCAEEHRQLAAWLRELVERRKESKIVRCSECKHKSFCPSKIDCGNGLLYYIDFCSNGKMAKEN